MVHLHESWLKHLSHEFDSDYMQKLKAFLQSERDAGKQIYPPAKLWFNALDTTPLDQVKVVILGQDPYHGPNQAHGLSFSVSEDVRIPPSLINIFKELHNDLGIEPASHGNLNAWAKQGVLLLNSVLTVEAHKAGSHQNKGWERFTDAVIKLVNEQSRPIVFILWGAYAQRKASFVDESRHLVIRSVHPSPLSVHKGFFGTKPFSKANSFLQENGITPIDWCLD
ncbi:uracil-DNA glycosylase [Ahrensia marina]|uniref:Uracil-DNA glycosylase n=1 Tax=Ahrensia marina TaxID=1514904 RepID=A0A0N0E7H8_9HYPH|nr:uracil-DNA glycosylase [Ahrensia marina]KPB01208.1 uracil-DNA glycosylase [Ahrensia marina]